MLEARVEWSIGPSKLDVTLVHDGGTSEYDGGSPAAVMMAVTQDLLDASNDWKLTVFNHHIASDAEIEYTIIFTPN